MTYEEMKMIKRVDSDLRKKGFRTKWDQDLNQFYLAKGRGEKEERWSPVFDSHIDYMEWCLKEHGELLRRLSEDKKVRKR